MAEHEQAMADFGETLKAHAHRLVEQLEQGSFSEAVDTIHQLNQARDYGLYIEVGKLTRELHRAIVKLDLDVRPDHNESSQVADASDRLSYVVSMTEKAANRTMDLVEECAPLVNYLNYEAQSLSADWKRFTRREMSAEQFRELARRIETFLDRCLQHSSKLSDDLQDILLAQDFQDLTGQVIKRVTQLLKDVEGNLLQLVVAAAEVEKFTGISHDYGQLREEQKQGEKKIPSQGEGPQMNVDKREDVVSGQDDVDDLLSSLGF